MTANSQLISVKALRALMNRDSKSWVSPKNHQNSRLSALDGDSVKRLFDICFSLFVLIVFSPLYLILSFLVAVSSPGPVFYTQERVGKDFKHFGCIKFRTMVENADEVLESLMETSPHLRAEFEDNFKLKDDPRVTWIGKFLRLTSLDEFPQFWNVLRGDMSLVGTRPPTPGEVAKYESHHHQRLRVKPGLTGEWQVRGRSTVKNFEEVVKMDLDYQQKWSIPYDLYLIVQTFAVILHGRGAY